MVKSAISLSAYAKINLHLEVLGKRKDGFHDILSVFHSISLSDELFMERISEKDTCVVESPLMELPKKNTIVSAYEKFSHFSGIRDGVRVKILKNIPSGAGLGGGSSDAAAVLKGLNRIFNAGLTNDCLHKIALEIGSDVPFFLKGGAAVVRGRGEFLKPIFVSVGYFGVLVYPEITSSTAVAYRSLNRAETVMFPAFDPEEFFSSDCSIWPFFNSFEEPLFKMFPLIEEVKANLITCGCDFALMSGSGSSVFGLFKDEKKARIAYFKNLQQYKQCFLFFLLVL